MKPEADSFERDPALERAWRAHSAEAPPPEIDRAILAAAHRAVGSAPQDALKSAAEARRPQRWWMPLAAAATIGVIAIGILQLTPHEQSLVVSDERVTAVAREGAEAQKPAPVIGKTADDTAKEHDASTGMRSPTIVASSGSDTPDFRQKKKQEAKPGASGSARAPSPPSQTASIEPENEIAGGKLAAGAPEPQPFPAANKSQEETFADMKRDRSGAGGASNASNALSLAPTATTQAAPAATVEEGVAPRKDGADERQRRTAAVTDKTASSAQSARPASTSEGAISSFASTPAPPAALPAASPSPAPPAPPSAASPAAPPAASPASPSVAPPAPPPAGSSLARDAGVARNEAAAQAAPGATPSRMLGKKVASLDELRAQARDPDAWIVRIRKLRDEGNTAEAVRELREFRNLVPDADQRLPADLLAWANTFKP